MGKGSMGSWGRRGVILRWSFRIFILIGMGKIMCWINHCLVSSQIAPRKIKVLKSIN